MSRASCAVPPYLPISRQTANPTPAAQIGYPAQPEEIDWFVQMMKKAAPKMSEEDVQTIEKALKSFKRT